MPSSKPELRRIYNRFLRKADEAKKRGDQVEVERQERKAKQARQEWKDAK